MTATDKGLHVRDILNRGQRVEGVFVTADVHRGTDKNGNDYWSFNLVDATGSVAAKIWTVNGVLHPAELEPRTFVRVQGTGNPFRDVMQVRVENLRTLTEAERAGLDMNDFLPPSPYDGPAAMEKLMHMVRREVADTPWEPMVDLYFGDAERSAAFAAHTAARTVHHAGRGGLAVHSLEVCRTCLAMADVYPGLDRPILAVGALFHDVGKIEEMDSDPFETSYTVPGNIVGHMVLGAMTVREYCERTNVPGPLRDHLIHLILSHHGRVEFGAVKEPATREAQVLAQADMLSARMNSMGARLAELKEGEMTTFRETVYHVPPTSSFVADRGAREGGTDRAPASAASAEDADPVPAQVRPPVGETTGGQHSAVTGTAHPFEVGKGPFTPHAFREDCLPPANGDDDLTAYKDEIPPDPYGAPIGCDDFDTGYPFFDDRDELPSGPFDEPAGGPEGPKAVSVDGQPRAGVEAPGAVSAPRERGDSSPVESGEASAETPRKRARSAGKERAAAPEEVGGREAADEGESPRRGKRGTGKQEGAGPFPTLEAQSLLDLMGRR